MTAIAVANSQTAGVVALLNSYSTYNFDGKGWLEFLTMHVGQGLLYLLAGDTPLTPGNQTLSEHVVPLLGERPFFERGDGTTCILDAYAFALDQCGDRFLTRWRVRAEEQAELGLNPLHLLSGASTDYYAVILVSAGLASIPVFMSITTVGVCHIVHAIPGNLDAYDGMPLFDAYLPMEHLCFQRHVRMLRTAAPIDVDYRAQLPLVPTTGGRMCCTRDPTGAAPR